MSNYSIGHEAERKASDYLLAKKFEIITTNWRTRVCEIDIIAKKDKVIYFVEVKYRRNNDQGTGLDYITHSKLRRMTFAAELWVGQNKWQGSYQLAAVEVSGYPFQISQFVPNLT